MQRRCDAYRPRCARMRRDRNVVGIGQCSDAAAAGEAARARDVGLHDVEQPLFQKWPESRRRELTLTCRQPHALERTAYAPVTGQIVRHHRLLQPEYTERFGMLADRNRGGRVITAVGIEHHVDIRTHRFAHRIHARDVGFLSTAYLHFDRGVAARRQPCRFLRHHRGRVEQDRRRIRGEFAAAVARQQLRDGQTQFFAHEVPQRNVDSADRFEQVTARMPARAHGAVHVVPDALDVECIAPDHYRRQHFLDHGARRSGAEPHDAFADPGQPFVGMHAHERGEQRLEFVSGDAPRLRERRLKLQDLDAGDFHGVIALNARPATRPCCPPRACRTCALPRYRS